MRILCTLSICFLCLLLLSACAPVQKDGIANYDKNTCSLGLTTNLFPSDEFLNCFEVKKSDYHYWNSDDWTWGYAKVFAYLNYDSATYAQAKEYCLGAFNLSVGDTHIYDEYTFVETTGYTPKNASANWALKSEFPQRFNMFGYHDESNTLFFLGYYNGNPQSEECSLAKRDFGGQYEKNTFDSHLSALPAHTRRMRCRR